MVSIKRFEDLFSWQKAHELTTYIYKLTKKPEFYRDRGLTNQIQRSAVSVMANQAEGFSRGTKQELINYFYIAKGSAGEVQSHLYIARDLQYIDISEFQNAYNLAGQCQKLIESFVQKVKTRGQRGLQYKQVQNKNAAMIYELQNKLAEKRMRGENDEEMQKELLKLQGIDI